MSATASPWAVSSNFLGPHAKAVLWPLSRFGQTVFSFIGADGTVTAVGGSQECAVIDTGHSPRVSEIGSAIAWALIASLG